MVFDCYAEDGDGHCGWFVFGMYVVEGLRWSFQVHGRKLKIYVGGRSFYR